MSPDSAGDVRTRSTGGPLLFVDGGTPARCTCRLRGGDEIAIGPIGDDSRRMRFLRSHHLGVISNFASDNLTIVSWDGLRLPP